MEELTGKELFESRLGRFQRAYLFIFIFSSAVLAAGILVAVEYRVSLGIAIAALAAVVYKAATKKELYSRLGMEYRYLSGNILIKAFYAREQKEAFIPRRIMWCNVTAVGSRAFCHASSRSVEAVYLPDTIEQIEDGAFAECDQLRLICFSGSREQWDKIRKPADIDRFEISFLEEKSGGAKECNENERDEA